MFVQVVKLARELGLVKLGAVAIDGAKVKANASRHEAMSYEQMQQAEAELKTRIDALLQRATSSDEADADEPELDLPAKIERRKTRLKAIVAARERLEQRQRNADTERGRSNGDVRRPRSADGKPRGDRHQRGFGVPEPKAQENFTDPDSQIMKRAGGGFDSSHNAQTAVDDTAYIIVAAELGNNAVDVGQLLPMPQAIQGDLGELPGPCLAAAGYRSEENFAKAKDSATKLVVALARGQAPGAGRCRYAPAYGRHGGEVADRGRPCRVPPTQEDRQAAEWLDQERAGAPPVQHAGT